MMQTQKKVSKAAATGPRGEINLSSPRVNSFLLATDEACKFLISNLKASNRAANFSGCAAMAAQLCDFISAAVAPIR